MLSEWRTQTKEVAEARGWSRVETVDVDDLAQVSPEGPPVIVGASRPLSVAEAQQIRAISTSRDICVVATALPLPEASRWLPRDCFVEVRHSSTPASGETLEVDKGVSQELLNETVLAVLNRLDEMTQSHESQGCPCGEELGIDGPFYLLVDNWEPTAFVYQLSTPEALTAVGQFYSSDIWEVPQFRASKQDAIQKLGHEAAAIWQEGPVWGGVHQWDAVAAAVAEGYGDAHAFVLHPATQPRHISEAVAGALHRADHDSLREFASDIRCPSVELDRLAPHQDPRVRYYVARNISTSRETLVRLVDREEGLGAGASSDLPISDAALANPRMRDGTDFTAALETALTRSMSWIEKVQIATHPDTSMEVLTRLSDDDGDPNFEVVAAAVAWNPVTPTAVIDRLAASGLYGFDDVLAARSIRDGAQRAPQPLAAFDGDWSALIRTIDQQDPQPAVYGTESYESIASQLVITDLDEAQLVDLARARPLMYKLAAACHPNATPAVLSAVLDRLLDDDVLCHRACLLA